ncbi:hypothetical protein TIFTF001_015373 [Ficus carica]|uniref:Uncharacterized protein n=1 Tax=Ficus carica TaxID=3494 RepID=A0AA88A5I6_FICCA|nr:hypothetical protein TIFTF001_015373 [Ficus carica]
MPKSLIQQVFPNHWQELLGAHDYLGVELHWHEASDSDELSVLGAYLFLVAVLAVVVASRLLPLPS